MITDDGNEDSDGDPPEEPLIKCEVKEEVEAEEDVNSDFDWSEVGGGREGSVLGVDRSIIESFERGSVKEEEDEEEADCETRNRKRRGVGVTVKKISNKYKRQRTEKQSLVVEVNEDLNENEVGDEDEEDEYGDGGSRRTRRECARKKKNNVEDWNESMEDGDSSKNMNRRYRTRTTKKKPPPQEVTDEEEDSESENEERKSTRKTTRKQKDDDWDESKEYYEDRINAKKCKEKSLPNVASKIPKMPDMFFTVEEFTEYMDKRVEACIEAALEDAEDPRCHHHFYLAIHECIQVGLAQGLVGPNEEDDIWKKYDHIATEKYESSGIIPGLPKKKKQRVVNRRYIRVDRVDLKEEEYQDMMKKTRRLKTLIVRDHVLKSVEENNGENKIRNDLKVRREFFEMLLDVPGSDSKVAILSSIKNLWKHLVYGKKEDWQKYLTHKERVLEKRKELNDPDNVKMRRYLYRQAYIASLPKEEIDRRNRYRAEYFKEKRSNLSEEKRKELREKNRQWRNSLSGDRREKYIEKVYSAIRKRNERLKYERAGLTPPPELLPVRKGRNNKAGQGTQNVTNNKGEDDGEALPTPSTSGVVVSRCGNGRGRGRAPRKFGTGQRIVPSISSSGAPARTRAPVLAASVAPPLPFAPQSPPLDLLQNISTRLPPQTQPQSTSLSSVYPNFGVASSLDYLGHDSFHEQCHQQSYHSQEHFPPMSSAISESNHSSVATPLSTPPCNYSSRDIDRQHVSQESLQPQNSYGHQEANHRYDFGNDDPPSPSPYFDEDSVSNHASEPSSSFSNTHMPVDVDNRIAPVTTLKEEKTDAPKQNPSSAITLSKNTSSVASGTPEICEECGMQFSRSYDLRKHINFAHSEDDTNRRCPVCGKEFNLPRSLWRHIVRHHRGNTDATKEAKPKRVTRVDHGPCRCEICGKEFLTGDIRKAYRDHMRRTHNKKDKSAAPEPPKPKEPRPKTVRCELCDKEMLYISLQRHKRNAHHTGGVKSFGCEECGKMFKDKRYLTDHVRLTHSFNFQKMIESRNLLAKSYSKEDPGKEVFKCTICSENIGERLEFRTHLLKKHPDVFQEISSSGAAYSKRECEVCKATFPKEIELREHLTSEHPDLCWNCPHCAKFICSQASLQKHIKNIHTQKKSKDGGEEAGKKCPKCGDMVEGGEAELWLHIKSMHNEIIVYCKYCTKPKWSKKLLSDHHRICRLKPDPKDIEEDEEHSGDRVTCKVCGTKLKHQGSLDRHMREIHKVHRIEFKCEEADCNEMFTQKSKLYDHLEQVHGNKVKRYRKKKKKKKSMEVTTPPSPPPPRDTGKSRKSERKRTQVTKYQEVQVKVERLTEEELTNYLKIEPG